MEQTQKLLEKQRIDALLVSSAYNIGYLTGFFGFSKIEREGYLLLTSNHTYIFASGLNSEAVEKHLKTLRHPELDSGSHEMPKRVRHDIVLITISTRTPLTKKALAAIIRKEKLKKIGFEKHSLLFSEYERLKKDLHVRLIPTEHLVEKLRMIKTSTEIEAIEKACRLGDKAFDHILTKMKPGMTEKELAFEIELFIRKTGADISFPPIVAVGSNSSIPHHVSDDERLMTDSWVLLDFGVRIDNYCSDMTRTVFLGKPTGKQKRMYETVLQAQEKVLDFIASRYNDTYHRSVRTTDVDRTARDYIVKKNYPTILHSLGHGIGLEVHEPPRVSPKSKDILKPGMVFSVEPGIYLPGVGGIRIEDLVVLSPSGPQLLTRAKRTLIEV